MGACNIDFSLKKKASQAEIELKFKYQQEADQLENGNSDSYTGDFQTVSKVDYHLDKIFSDHDEAYQYCLKHASKWDTVVAVYFEYTGKDGTTQIGTLVAGWGAC